MIAVTVWDDQPPRKTLRVLSTWREGLAAAGIEDPGEHLAAVRSWGTVTYLASRSRWTSEQTEQIRTFSRDRGFDPLILPDVAPGERDRLHALPDPAFLDVVDTLVHGVHFN